MMCFSLQHVAAVQVQSGSPHGFPDMWVGETPQRAGHKLDKAAGHVHLTGVAPCRRIALSRKHKPSSPSGLGGRNPHWLDPASGLPQSCCS